MTSFAVDMITISIFVGDKNTLIAHGLTALRECLSDGDLDTRVNLEILILKLCRCFVI